jgi:hypothetical protein
MSTPRTRRCSTTDKTHAHGQPLTKHGAASPPPRPSGGDYPPVWSRSADSRRYSPPAARRASALRRAGPIRPLVPSCFTRIRPRVRGAADAAPRPSGSSAQAARAHATPASTQPGTIRAAATGIKPRTLSPAGLGPQTGWPGPCPVHAVASCSGRYRERFRYAQSSPASTPVRSVLPETGLILSRSRTPPRVQLRRSPAPAHIAAVAGGEPRREERHASPPSPGGIIQGSEPPQAAPRASISRR